MNKPIRDIPFPLPFELLRRFSGLNPLIVNYHVVSDGRLPHVENLYGFRNIKTFINDLDFFCKKFHPIGLVEFLESLENKTTLPRNSLMLTFDDGFREVYEVVAPLLLERKLTTTVFLTSNFIDNKNLNHDNKKSLIIDLLNRQYDSTIINKLAGILHLKDMDRNVLVRTILEIPYVKRFLIDELAFEMKLDFKEFLADVKPYLNSSQIQKLIDTGFTFGSHSIDHARYSELSLEDQIHQTIRSTESVTKTFNLPYRVFAFPYSDVKVTKGFFDAIEGKIDASFGTQGLLKDEAVRNFQRITVEKFNMAAIQTVKFQYKRKIIRSLVQRDTIIR